MCLWEKMMTNKEKAIEIFRLLEEKHINLYHNISKNDFQNELNKFLKFADKLDDIHFDAEMSKLFSLFKDAHTMYQIKDKYIEKCIKLINAKYYFYDVEQKICEEIVMVNDIDFKIVYKKLKKIIQYDAETWADFMIAFKLRGLKHLQMIDCENKKDVNEIKYTLKSGKEITKVYKERAFNMPLNYSFILTEDNILKINYLKCREMENYSFKQFIEDIKKKCKILPHACLIDVRKNDGGSDSVVKPLFDWLKENKIKTYGLMNEGVFSSGTFTLLDMKKELNAILIGTEAGQAAHAYGNIKWINVDDKNFSYCTRYFNRTTIDTKQKVKPYPMDNIINYLGPIKPDIYLEEKIEDVKLGIDGQLRDCIEIIKQDLKKEKILE